MERNAKPIVVCFGYTDSDGNLVFNVSGLEVVVQSFVNEFISVASLCNGLRTINEIVEMLSSFEDALILQIIKFMLQKRIAVCSTEQFQFSHAAASNPSLFSVFLNSSQVSDLKGSERVERRKGESIPLGDSQSLQFNQIATKRTSTRVFSEEPLSLRELSGFLQNLYGNGNKWFTPAAGGLYPVDIYLVNFDNKELAEGIYQFLPETQELVRVYNSAPLDHFSYAMNTSELLNGSTQIIALSVNLRRLSAKYSNRGYRYGLIDVGHIAQNAYLYAAESGLGILEYGGYQDSEICRLLGLDPVNNPVMITLVLGNKSKGNSSRPKKSLSKLSEELERGLVQEGILKDEILLKTYTFHRQVIPRVFGFGLYGLKDPSQKAKHKNALYSCGSGNSLHETKIKVLAEAYERHMSNHVTWDIRSDANSLEVSYLVPPKMKPGAYKVKQIDKFSTKAVIEWKQGYEAVTNTPVMVPIDMVYYPLSKKNIGRAPIYKTSSNGVAAHTDRNQAILSATLELVERDALMVHWFSKKEPCRINISSLPAKISARCNILQCNGVEIKFLDITLDTVPVVLCLIVSDHDRPYFASGASASFSLEEAVIKSFNEAEFMFHSWRNMKYSKIEPKAVKSVKDHGRVYIDTKHHSRLKWLLKSPISKVTGESSNISLGELLNKLKPVVVELATPTDDVPLWVVRVISSDLLPIHFGYGQEHDVSDRLKALGLQNKRRYPAFPHFFA